MRLIRRLRGPLGPAPRGCVATIGNFDGVHRGHQALIAGMRESAQAAGVSTAVVCFEPTPQEHFQGAAAPARLTSLREKHARLATHGVDRMVALPFGAALAGLSPEAFVQRVLVEGLAVREVWVGDDFRFGQGRAGDVAQLTRLGAAAGFTVRRAPTLVADGERISSTRVRRALAAGDLDGAERLLGWRYGLCGRVAHGEKRGRQLGFPTANLPLRRHAVATEGVFLVAVRGAGEASRYGAASIGRRPAVGGRDLRCEVHLFDFAGDLYGRVLEVTLLQRLRDEWHFDSLAGLREQIARDVAQASSLVSGFRKELT